MGNWQTYQICHCTAQVLKSLKLNPNFVLRSLNSCDCVRVCLLTSRSWRSSGTPARDLPSSTTLNNATPSSSSREKNNRTHQRHPGNHSQIDVAPRACQAAHAPDVQVDRGLEKKAVMGPQLDLGCLCTGASPGREVVRAALIVDIFCGLVSRWLQGQQSLWLWGREHSSVSRMFSFLTLTPCHCGTNKSRQRVGIMGIFINFSSCGSSELRRIRMGLGGLHCPDYRHEGS